MERLWRRLFIVLLIVLVVGMIACAIAVNNFHRNGVQFFGNNIHVSFARDCYFIDRETLEVTGQSRFCISGYQFDRFTGVMNLEQYPMTADTIGDISAVRRDRNRWMLSGHGVRLNDDWERYYLVYFLRSNPNVVVIDIFQNGGETITAVCADSPEEAAANYRTYLAEYK